MLLSSCILLASAAIFGSVAGFSDTMVHELITQTDGTVGDFSYHSSFIPDTDAAANSSATELANDFSDALANEDMAGKPCSSDKRPLQVPQLPTHSHVYCELQGLSLTFSSH